MSARKSTNERTQRPPPVGRAATALRVIQLALLAAAVTLTLASRAEAYIYWANSDVVTESIGRANLDGTAVEQSFIAPVDFPTAVAADDQHLYWTTPVADSDVVIDSIGRANLEGTGVDPSFIANPPGMPVGVAVDDAHVYWASTDGAESIGRANLDGTGVDASFIAAPGFAAAVAVDDAHLYWSEPSGPGAIGRANLDGSGVDQSFIATGGSPTALAVDDAYLYWASTGTDSIGRANLDGTGVDPSFIPASYPLGVAVDDAHLYWSNSAADSIGRANLDGTGIDQSFIGVDAPYGGPHGVAVGSLAFVSLGNVKRNTKRGTATITAKVPIPGELRLAENRKVKGKRKAADVAGEEKLPVKPRGKAKKKLNETGKARVRAKVSYAPEGGEPDTESKRVKLVKR